MKRFWLLFIALLLVAGMAVACNSGAGPTTNTTEEEPAAEEPAAEEPAAEEPAAEEPAAEEPTEEAAEEPAEETASEGSGDAVEIRWFVGLGTGGNEEQRAAQDAVVAEFNETHDDIELVIEYYQNDVAYDTLQTQIAAGNAPDIVGPVGVRGLNGFRDQILDLAPYIEESGYDVSDYPPELVEFWNQDGKQVGLPFAVFPSFIYYNRDLFDEAGLPYPPQEFGADYEGEPWDMDALRELAMQLTVDAEGNDATSEDFDAENIEQYGFVPQWGDDPRAEATFFGPGLPVDDEGNASIPEHWRAAWEWFYNGMWEDHFIPTGVALASDQFPGGNAFSSGNVAMAFTHLWYTCCVDPAVVTNWDIAVVPAYEGETTAKLHADTFVILESTEHPDEAFEVLTWLLNDAELDLLAVYGGLPAHLSKQEEFFAGLDETFAPNEVNWQVAIDSLEYPDNPNHEADLPNFLRADDAIKAFGTLYHNEPDVDLQAEIDALEETLQGIFDEAGSDSGG